MHFFWFFRGKPPLRLMGIEVMTPRLMGLGPAKFGRLWQLFEIFSLPNRERMMRHYYFRAREYPAPVRRVSCPAWVQDSMLSQ
jgi:hypothetical protein